ncbi:MAG: response regulator transcription factor [Gudongella sp.]|jgi:DNA-binding NarL/FixJ family response regulator|nr:response regulator transcription factor [Gudongella sp.]
MYRVLIVEDQRIVQKILEETISQSEEYKIIGTIENAQNAIAFCLAGKIDLILMDVCTAEGESGIDAAKKIKRDFPNIKIVVITSMPEESFIRKAKEAKCDSFWYKDDSDGLLEVMDKTMKGANIYPEETPLLDIGYASSVNFTARELEVLRELVNGFSYREVANELDIKERTVKQHISNMLSKTGYKSTMQLVVDVVNKNLIIPGY